VSTLHWVALATSPRIGGKTMTALLRHFGDLEAVFSASHAELLSVPGIGDAIARIIVSTDLEHISHQIESWRASGIQMITWQDAAYPIALFRVESSPPVLFVRGSLDESDHQAVAIIGSRTPAEASRHFAFELGKELASQGWVVVSGLALGIDAAAHEGALAGGGRTLAILGCGLNRMYPAGNHPLAGRILQHGAVLSELAPPVVVSPQNLVARNRITAGLSRAVIVVESKEDSGSLHTVRQAQQIGCPVMAVTGQPSGNEQVLRSGALPISGDRSRITEFVAILNTSLAESTASLEQSLQ
jgi:DNA processing protein